MRLSPHSTHNGGLLLFGRPTTAKKYFYSAFRKEQKKAAILDKTAATIDHLLN
jgi:hypothetical protein